MPPKKRKIIPKKNKNKKSPGKKHGSGSKAEVVEKESTRKKKGPEKQHRSGSKAEVDEEESKTPASTVVGTGTPQADVASVVVDEAVRAEIKKHGLVAYMNRNRVGVMEIPHNLLTVDNKYIIRPLEESHVQELMDSMRGGFLWKDNLSVIFEKNHEENSGEKSDFLGPYWRRCVLDGAHRYEARKRLLSDAAKQGDQDLQDTLKGKLEENVPVLGYVNVPLGVCNLYSATVNDMQTMGKGQSLVDTVYGLFRTIQRLTSSGILSDSEQKDFRGKQISKNLPDPGGDSQAKTRALVNLADVFYRLADAQAPQDGDSFSEHYLKVVGSWVDAVVSCNKYPPADVRRHFTKLVRKAKLTKLFCFSDTGGGKHDTRRAQWLVDVSSLSKYVFKKTTIETVDGTPTQYRLYLRVVTLLFFRVLVANIRKAGLVEYTNWSMIHDEAVRVSKDEHFQKALEYIDEVEDIDADPELRKQSTPWRDPSFYCALRLALLPAYTDTEADADLGGQYERERTHSLDSHTPMNRDVRKVLTNTGITVRRTMLQPAEAGELAKKAVAEFKKVQEVLLPGVTLYNSMYAHYLEEGDAGAEGKAEKKAEEGSASKDAEAGGGAEAGEGAATKEAAAGGAPEGGADIIEILDVADDSHDLEAAAPSPMGKRKRKKTERYEAADVDALRAATRSPPKKPKKVGAEELEEEAGEKEEKREGHPLFSKEGPMKDYPYVTSVLEYADEPSSGEWAGTTASALESGTPHSMGTAMVVVWPDGVNLLSDSKSLDPGKYIARLAKATWTHLTKSAASCDEGISSKMSPLVLVPFCHRHASQRDKPASAFEISNLSTTRAMSVIRKIFCYETKLFTEIESVEWTLDEDLNGEGKRGNITWLVFSTADAEEVFKKREKLQEEDITAGPVFGFSYYNNGSFNYHYKHAWGNPCTYGPSDNINDGGRLLNPAFYATDLIRSLYLPRETQIMFLPRQQCKTEPYIMRGADRSSVKREGGYAVGAMDLLGVAAVQLNKLVHFLGRVAFQRVGGIDPVSRREVRALYEKFDKEAEELKKGAKTKVGADKAVRKLFRGVDRNVLELVELHYVLQAQFRTEEQLVYADPALEYALGRRQYVEEYQSNEIVFNAETRVCEATTQDNDTVKTGISPGIGVFSTKVIPSGTLVVHDFDYELLWGAEEDPTRDLIETRAFGTVSTNYRVSVHEHSLVAKLNDYHGLAEEPNCEMYEKSSAKEKEENDDTDKVTLFTFDLVARKDIPAGEQLLLDYGEKYLWGDNSKSKDAASKENKGRSKIRYPWVELVCCAPQCHVSLSCTGITATPCVCRTEPTSKNFIIPGGGIRK